MKIWNRFCITNYRVKLESGCLPVAVNGLIILLVMVIMSAIMTSCKSVQYVPVETVKTEYRDHYIRDSISFIQLDSILIKEKGDSIIIEKYKYVYRDRDKLITDTIYISIEVDKPYPVEKQLTWWQSIKIEIGGVLIGILVFLIIIVGYTIFKKLKP